MSAKQARLPEVAFCAQVKSWADALFAERPELGFRRVEIEESSARSRKRSDLRVYDAVGNLRLAGEVKLPGTPEGRNAFAHDLIEDAFRKAANAGAEFFFTWNVNDFVLFDAKAWQKPLEERKVRAFPLGLALAAPEDVGRPEVAARYLAPEVHSLMAVRRPVVQAAELDRLILSVSDPIGRLKGTYVARYLHYGETATFASSKSKPVPVAKRSTCADRDPWYDLTYTRRGHLVWTKSQQCRHIVVHNTGGLIVNCNLYDVSVLDPQNRPPALVATVLNSTLVGFWKCFYGRYAGTEGNLKTEVVDVALLEVPDPIHARPAVRSALTSAFASLCSRDTGELVEEELKACHSAERAAKLAAGPPSLPWELRQPDRRALDLAVLELLGVDSPTERERLCDELYREVAAHFRRIRLVEIQKQEQRSRTADEDRAADLAGLLKRWMLHGRPAVGATAEPPQ